MHLRKPCKGHLIFLRGANLNLSQILFVSSRKWKQKAKKVKQCIYFCFPEHWHSSTSASVLMPQQTIWESPFVTSSSSSSSSSFPILLFMPHCFPLPRLPTTFSFYLQRSRQYQHCISRWLISRCHQVWPAMFVLTHLFLKCPNDFQAVYKILWQADKNLTCDQMWPL